jgi:hypothetical protein
MVLVVGMGLVFLGWSGSIWVRVQVNPDTGYERLAEFLAQQVPERSRVAVASTSAAIILTDYVQGKVSSPDELVATGADYLELSIKNVENNYGEPSPEFYAWIVQHGQPVFSFTGRSYGTLVVYHFPKIRSDCTRLDVNLRQYIQVSPPDRVSAPSAQHICNQRIKTDSSILSVMTVE